MYCRDTVWRGVIRKAGSRAGKFKDHEGEGVRLYHQNLALYELVAWDCTRSEYDIGARHTRAPHPVSKMWHSY